MTTLLWQTAALLLGAYFLGAFVGCLLRRAFFRPAAVTAVAVPAGVVDHHAAAPRVEVDMPADAPVHARRFTDHDPIRPKIESIPATSNVASAVETDDADLAAAAERFKKSLSSQSDYIYPTAPAPVDAIPEPEPAPEAIAPEPEPEPEPQAEPEPEAEAPPQPEPPPPAPTPEPPVQRPAIAETVQQRGASATGAAVAAAMAAAAAGGGRSSAGVSPARPAADRPDLPAAAGSAGQSSTSAPIVVPVVVAAAAAAAATATRDVAATAAAQPPDDLTRIRAIDPELQSKLKGAGVNHFADIAAWRNEDVRRISELLGFKGRIEHENWIEQAQILAGGGMTAFARRQSETPLRLAKPSGDEGTPSAPDAMAALSRSSAARSGLGAAIASSIASLPPRRPALALGRDNLQRISHVSEEVERLLNVQGVSRYNQIAHWSETEVTRFDRLLGSEGRISRENWIEQAQILSRGGGTAYSREYDRNLAPKPDARPRPTQLAEAIRAAGHADPVAPSDVSSIPAGADAAEDAGKKVDLTALRSVRSEARRGGVAEGVGAQQTGSTPPVRPDDLKRIRGVGVLIEKRLNAMGVWSYEQVANWSNADIDRISQALEFRGRIERENWVEQARILASGGQTEFAKRVDRGEVETSRPKR